MTTIYFVDTETGGLDPRVHSILSVGCVKWIDGKIVKEYEGYIQEDPLVVTPGALKINQIDLREYKAWEPAIAAVDFLSFILSDDPHQRPVIGGHNTPFDIGFVKRICRLGDQSYPFHYRYVDTSPVTRALIDAGRISPNNGGLFSLCEYFGIENKQRHGALGDARATAELYTKLLEVLKG